MIAGGPVAAYAVPAGLNDVVLAALLAGLLAAPWLAATVAGGARPARRADGALAGLVLVGAAWLLVYSFADDAYSGASRMTRWEFGGTGGRFFVPVAVAATGVAVLLLTVGRPGRRRLRGAALAAASVACGLLLVGFFTISIGH